MIKTDKTSKQEKIFFIELGFKGLFDSGHITETVKYSSKNSETSNVKQY